MGSRATRAFLLGTALAVGLIAAACDTAEPTATQGPTLGPTPTGTAAPTPTATRPSASATPTTQPTATPTPTFDAASYFGSKNIRVVVGFSPGGGYDTLARLVSHYLPRHMPGSPRFIIQNVVGAGNLRAIQTVVRATPDGLIVGEQHPRYIVAILAGENVEGFALSDLEGVMVGAPTARESTNSLFARREVVETWDDVLNLGRNLVISDVAPGGTSALAGQFAAIAGAPIDVVFGYGGTSERMAALDRGEVDATHLSPETVYDLFPEWVEDRFVAPLWWVNVPPEEDQEYQDFLQALGISEPPPYMFDLPGLSDVSAGEVEVYKLAWELQTAMGRMFYLPPGTPPHIVDTWREAFRATVTDPEFVAHALTAGYDVGHTSAENLESILGRAINALPSNDAHLIDIFKQLASGG